MEKEKVLIVHNYYQIPGGEDTVVANEKKMLEDKGHEVFMYTRHNDEIKKRGIIGKALLPFETIYSLKTLRGIKTLIKKNKIDIVHVHNTFPLISPSVYKAAKDCGVKVVQTVHNFRLLCPGATFVRNGQICEECITKGLGSAIKHSCYRESKIQTIIATTMLKFNRMIGSYDKVDTYIALTDFNKDKLSSLISIEKIFVKPNFCEKPNIPTVPTAEREYFMFLGRLDKLKGVNLLVEAWKDIKNEELVIVGTGPEEKWARQYVEVNGMDNVKLLGFKGKEEAMELLGRAKALIVPSQWYEGFPMTIVESLSLEVPIIGYNIGNITSVLKEEKGCYLFNNSYELKDYIKQISIYSKVDSNNMKKLYVTDENYKILSDCYRRK